MVLLSAVYGRPVSPVVMKQARRPAGHWRRGDKALAHIELAFARLPRLEDEADAFRLFLAEALLDEGMNPRELARGLGLPMFDAARPPPIRRRKATNVPSCIPRPRKTGPAAAGCSTCSTSGTCATRPTRSVGRSCRPA